MAVFSFAIVRVSPDHYKTVSTCAEIFISTKRCHAISLTLSLDFWHGIRLVRSSERKVGERCLLLLMRA
jgi:hypothetical protein